MDKRYRHTVYVTCLIMARTSMVEAMPGRWDQSGFWCEGLQLIMVRKAWHSRVDPLHFHYAPHPTMPPTHWTGVDALHFHHGPQCHQHTGLELIPSTSIMAPNATNTLDLQAIFPHDHADTTTPDYATGMWMNQVRNFRLRVFFNIMRVRRNIKTG